MPFNYEEAELDILENGGDPDYLSHSDPMKRDNLLRKMGLNPESYGGGMRDPEVRKLLENQARQPKASANHPDGEPLDLGCVAAIIAVCVVFFTLSYIISLLVEVWFTVREAFIEPSPALRTMIFVVPLCLVLYRYDIFLGFQKALKWILLILGAPIRLAHKWYHLNSLSMLSCLVGFLLDLALMSALFLHAIG